MKLILALSVAFVAFATISTAWARLGETEQECEKRYGKPSTPDPEGYVVGLGRDDETPQLEPEKRLQYSKNGVLLFIGFIDGKAVRIQYSFPNRTNPLERNEIEALLELNAPDRKWYYEFRHPFALTGGPPDGVGQDAGIFWSTDGEFFASFTRRSPHFTIMKSPLMPTFRFDRSAPKSLEGF
jgi:hypothetical protein